MADMVDDPLHGSRNDGCALLQPALFPALVLDLPQRHEGGNVAHRAGEARERADHLGNLRLPRGEDHRAGDCRSAAEAERQGRDETRRAARTRAASARTSRPLSIARESFPGRA